MKWIALITAAVSGAIWILQRWLKRRDANEIQRTIERARTDAVAGNDRDLNADLAAARDRVQNRDANPGR